MQTENDTITIDTLAVMINNGFKEVHGRIDTLDHNLNARVDTLENTMNYRFNGIQNQIDNISLAYTPRREHDETKVRVTRIERKLGINPTSGMIHS